MKHIDWNRVKSHPISRTLPYWIAAITVGLLSTAYAKLFAYLSDLSITLYRQNPWLIFLFAPAFFVLGWLCVRKLSPKAGGSGIPQVLVSLDLEPKKNKEEINGLLGLKVAGVKILSSAFCLMGGGAIGREGPTLQISTSVFHTIGNWSRKIWPEASYHSWIVAGGAAGIASAFNTPLGGIVYAIEELSSIHFHKFKTAAVSAVIVSGVTAQALLGPYLYLGTPNVEQATFEFFGVALLVGTITGACGALFGETLFGGSSWIRKKIPQQKQWWVPVLAGLSLAVMFFTLHRRAIGPGSDVNADLLFQNVDHSSVSLIVTRFVSSVVSYLSGCAGGIFAPSLAIGASIGAEIAKALSTGNDALIVLLGMIGVLTGITHAPFTSFVLIFEMTDRHSAIFPMMLASLAAHTAARLISSHSFYEQAKVFYSPKVTHDSSV